LTIYYKGLFPWTRIRLDPQVLEWIEGGP